MKSYIRKLINQILIKDNRAPKMAATAIASYLYLARST